MPANAARVRHPVFDYTQLESSGDRHYFNANAFATHLLNSFHVVIPLGERFMIRSAQPFLGQVQNAETKKNLKIFIGQETVHAARHMDLWPFLEKQGFSPTTFALFYEKTAYGFFEPLLQKILGEKINLAISAGLEHYFSILGNAALENDSAILEGLEPGVKALMQWHAAEEIEHKSFAFDVLKEVDDSYSLRIAGYLLSTVFLFGYGGAGMLYFLLKDRKITWQDMPSDVATFLRMTDGLGGKFLTAFLEFFKPEFHPNQAMNDHLIRDINALYGSQARHD